MTTKKIPLVSVLMPAYNAQDYIGDSIQSILDQTYSNYELIILNDGSTDNTQDIIQKFASHNPQIRAEKNLANLGIAGNRNKLLSYAKGEYIVRQDADDISLNDRISKQVNFMENNPDVGICGGYLEVFNSKGIISIRKYPIKHQDLIKMIFKFSPIAQPSAIVRKKSIEQVGGFDLYYPPAEDLDLTFRIGQYRKIANLPEIIIKYRESETNATSSKLHRMEMATLSIRLKYDGYGIYKMTWMDRFYQFAHLGSTFILPTNFKIRLFNIIRKYF